MERWGVKKKRDDDVHKSGDDVRGGPTQDEARFLRFARFGHVLYVPGS